MTIRLGVVMDPIATIQPAKDSTLAMMLAAQRRGWQIHYLPPEGVMLRDGRVQAQAFPTTVRDDPHDWFSLDAPRTVTLGALDVILMRKDPPFDMEYIYMTYLLEHAAREGMLVVNAPQALRDCNEKFFTTWFPDCIPPTLVGRDRDAFLAFLEEQERIVVKPLDAMGGASVFRIQRGDPNTNVILETLLDHGRRTALAQRFLPEYRQGDKRVLLVDGEPVGYMLARLPAPGEGRANLAAGGSYEGRPLGQREREIAARVGPALRERGVLFAGLDVIGDWLTEINITSPTCIRELDRLYGLDIAGDLLARIERHLG